MQQGRRKLVMESAYLHQEQLDALRERKARTHIPVAEQVRDAVSEYLRRRGIELPRLPFSADALEVQAAAAEVRESCARAAEEALSNGVVVLTAREVGDYIRNDGAPAAADGSGARRARKGRAA